MRVLETLAVLGIAANGTADVCVNGSGKHKDDECNQISRNPLKSQSIPERPDWKHTVGTQ